MSGDSSSRRFVALLSYIGLVLGAVLAAIGESTMAVLGMVIFTIGAGLFVWSVFFPRYWEDDFDARR